MKYSDDFSTKTSADKEIGKSGKPEGTKKKGRHKAENMAVPDHSGTGKTIALNIGRGFLFLFTFIIILLITVFLMMKIICGISVPARNTFITTVLETGQLKFVAGLCLPEDEIAEIVAQNSLVKLDETDINESLINIAVIDENPIGESADLIGAAEAEQPDVEIIDIAGLTYKATLMIVKDPSRLSLATIYQGNGSWPEKGITLEQFVEQNGAIGGINGGLYASDNNSGGYPYGVVVSNGEIVRNLPSEWPGMVLVGLTNNNILQIIDINGMTPEQCKEMIEERGIRDAVCFQEETSVDNNHFVQLIINGTVREISGSGSGLNPRTAIGQRADGSLLLLVTDGRGFNGHAGASAADLIDIMTRYGAVNAANLDGGSSTCMYYDNQYLQSCVTFYYSQSSWRMPFAFLLK